MFTTPHTTERERGFALLIVLWSLALLALLGTAIVAVGRSETRIATNTRDSAVASAAAEGAIEQTVFMILQGAWAPDGAPHALRIGRATVVVQADSEAAKINPNMTTTSMLQALMVALGADPQQAASLARAIVDWRTRSLLSISGGTKVEQYRAAGLPYAPPNRSFDSIDELGLVPGMTAELLDRMRPWLSVYQEGDVQASAADTVTNTALNDARLVEQSAGQLGFVSPNPVIAIDATARFAGARSTRRAIVRFRARPQAQEAPFQILSWGDQSQ